MKSIDFNPSFVICLSKYHHHLIGAAVQGAILKSGGTGGGAALDGISSDIVLLDVTPLSLGIELEGKVMSVLIPRNTPIPCVKSREYTTCEDFQTEIDVVVFEGERPQTSANNKLGIYIYIFKYVYACIYIYVFKYIYM
jgi:molecular chaperone DnaK (HSP70)